MTWTRSLQLLMATLIIVVSWSSAAQAAGRYGPVIGYGVGWPGLGFGYYYGTARVPAPPYFALHPPVYYGERVARPYGESPFAYLPALPPQPLDAAPYAPAAAAQEPVQPQLIINPYYQPQEGGQAGGGAAAEATGVRPQVTINPYY